MVTTVTGQRQKIFTDFYLGRLLVQAMKNQQQTGNVNSLAFVVMPDHLHWLFSLHNQATLAEVMCSVKGRSAQQIQQSHSDRKEITVKQALWQNGYYDHALRKEEDIKNGKIHRRQPTKSRHSR